MPPRSAPPARPHPPAFKQQLIAQGGQPQQALNNTISEAKRNAEALFESKSVAEIRDIEARTRKDIEQKKVQLRSLVGDSYRDLIESADKIVSIARSCESVLHSVKGIQQNFTFLSHSFTSADALIHERRESLTKHADLYAIGGRVKYLVDTPEVIWGSLDGRQFLDAARRYLRAEQVHNLLHTASSTDVLARFPLLIHHWPLVAKFKRQIIGSVHSSLTAEQILSSETAADALAAACALENLDSAAALQTFLSSRRAWMGQQLLAQPGMSSSTGATVVANGGAAAALAVSDGTSEVAAAPSAVAAQLSALAQSVQLTISQIGELFLASKAADASCLLQAVAREDEMDSSELLFGGRSALQPATTNADSGVSAEAEAWRKLNRTMHERLHALSSGQVESACVEWLRQVAADFTVQCPRLLSSCTTAAQLVEVEAAVRGAVADWQHPAAKAAAAAGTLGGAATRRRSAGGASVPGSEPQLESWEAICEWVLGRPMGLWQDLFHTPFVVRAKQLIADSFGAVGRALEVPLQECLATAAAANPEPAGHLSTSRWPQMATPSTSTSVADSQHSSGAPTANGTGGGGGGAAAARTGQTSTSQAAAVAASAGGGLKRLWSEKLAGGGRVGAVSVHGDKEYRHQVHEIRQHFDDQLREVLLAVLQLVGGSSEGGLGNSDYYASKMRAAAAGAAGQRLGGAARREGSGRAAELEPFVQQQCGELAATIASHLQGRLDALHAADGRVDGAAAAEQVLLIGRLCSALSSDSRYLPLILGPAEAWRQAVTAHGSAHANAAALRLQTARAAGAAVKGSAGQARVQAAAERFRGTSIAAYRAWACWASSSLAQGLRQALSADETLVATTTPLSWQETVLASEASPLDALSEPNGDLRFSLPACPSAALLSFFMAACQEVRRAGDHTVVAEALQVLEWELLGAALHSYSNVLQPATAGGGIAGRPPSEKGVLQLLMDVRLLRDVLSGGRPLANRNLPPPPALLPSLSSAASIDVGGVGGDGGSSFSKGRAVAPDVVDAEMLAALSERRRQVAALEAQLQDLLDPIDWATYEPHLWTNVARYYQRISILFGSLLQLQRAHPESGGKAVALQQMNPLNVLPVAPRFQYLPISAPLGAATAAASRMPSLPVKTASGSGSNLAAMARGLSSGAPGTAATSLLSDAVGRANSSAPGSADLAGRYSFADLGSSNSRGGVATSSDSLSGHASWQANTNESAFSALQARLQVQAGQSIGSISGLGSMLGDKAAEMTAIAQQRFGDIGEFLPTGALGGASNLFSSFAKGVSAHAHAHAHGSSSGGGTGKK